MGVKKHKTRFLTGCQKGCQKTLINKDLFFDTLRASSVRDVSCAFTFAQRHLTPLTLTKGN